MPAAWALVPIKSFAAAKTRLEGLLTRAECARLAEEMARDVLRALEAAPDISGIAILSTEPKLATLSEGATAGKTTRLYAEQDSEDYRAALGRVAADLASQGTRHLLVVPADLPTLSRATCSSCWTAIGAASRSAPRPRTAACAS
jgi:2-phospho-L-lactate guanylyltransferase (CobY/MobA/RfbA family)